MNMFFLSLVIIFAGGLSVSIISQRNRLGRAFGSIFIIAGCTIGGFNAGLRMVSGQSVSCELTYLNNLSLSFQADSLSAFFLIIIFGVSGLSALYSYHYLKPDDNSLSHAAHYFFFSILIIGMALVVTADNIIAFMLSWEIMSLSSFFLVIHNYQSLKNRFAGYLYFVFSHIGALFILAAFGIMYRYTHSFAFGPTDAMPQSAKILVFIFALIGFGSKAGVFPFHIWLPHAHPAAPSHISAIMSGVMIKTGIYAILRVYMLLDSHAPVFGVMIITVGLISGILGVVYTLGQHDLKKLLAYCSVENIGIILIGIGIGMIGVSTDNPVMAALGFCGGMLHILNHCIFKALLFMGAGMVLHKTGSHVIDTLGGLLKSMKITGTTFLIGSLAICGLPPFNGFISEFLIYWGGFKGIGTSQLSFVAGLLAIVSLAVIGGLALACFAKVIGVVFQGEPRNSALKNVHEKGLSMLIAMIILAGCCIVIGVFPGMFILMALKAVSTLNPGYGNLPLTPFIRTTNAISYTFFIFFIVVLLIWVLRTLAYKGKAVYRSGTWGCGFTQPTPKMQYSGSSFAASILEFFRPVAPLQEDHPAIKGLFPEKSVYHSQIADIAQILMERFILRPILWLFDQLRWIQNGEIHLYLGYILLTIVILLFFV